MPTFISLSPTPKYLACSALLDRSWIYKVFPSLKTSLNVRAATKPISASSSAGKLLKFVLAYSATYGVRLSFKACWLKEVPERATKLYSTHWREQFLQKDVLNKAYLRSVNHSTSRKLRYIPNGGNPILSPKLLDTRLELGVTEESTSPKHETHC